MKERKTVRQFTISADIYDMELPQKIQAALSDNLPDIQPELYYGIDVTFDKTVYSVPAFFQYPLDKRPLAPPGAQQTKEEKGRAILSAILNQQLEKIVQQVEALGFAIDSAGIEGADLSDLHRIDIRLFESAEKEYTKQGKIMKHYKVFNIMPDRPYLVDDAAQKLARLFHEQVKKGAIKQMEFERHTPHFRQAGVLFRAVAVAVLSEEGNADETAVQELSDKLLTQAVIESDWPLDIKVLLRKQKLPLWRVPPRSTARNICCTTHFRAEAGICIRSTDCNQPGRSSQQADTTYIKPPGSLSSTI